MGALLSWAATLAGIRRARCCGLQVDGQIDFEEFVAWWLSGSTTKKKGSVAYQMQKAREQVFASEMDNNTPMGRLLAAKKAAAAKLEEGTVRVTRPLLLCAHPPCMLFSAFVCARLQLKLRIVMWQHKRRFLLLIICVDGGGTLRD